MCVVVGCQIGDFGIARILEDSLALAMTFNGTSHLLQTGRHHTAWLCILD
jgi:hypothetical protein